MKYKKQMEEAKTKKARAEGAFAKLKEQLKSEFDCESLEEAEEKLKEMKENAKNL